MPQRLPHLADPVLYRPRVPYGRQSELAGQITRVWDAEKGDVDLIVFPAGSETQTISHAFRRNEATVVNCWEFTGLAADVERLEAEVTELRDSIDPPKTAPLLGLPKSSAAKQTGTRG